jgi:hypothetical protein
MPSITSASLSHIFLSPHLDVADNAESSRVEMEHNEGICVGIRMRPLNEKELGSGQSAVFKCLPNSNSVCQYKDGSPLEGQCYNYDMVFDENASTETVYSRTCSEIVTGVANGINGTVFACEATLIIVDIELTHDIFQMVKHHLERLSLWWGPKKQKVFWISLPLIFSEL